MARLNFDRDISFAFGCPVSGSTTTITTGATADGVDLSYPGVYRLYCTEDSYVCFGVSGSCDASATNAMYLEAGQVEYFSTLEAATWLSAIQVNSAGTVYATQMSASQKWIR